METFLLYFNENNCDQLVCEFKKPHSVGGTMDCCFKEKLC